MSDRDDYERHLDSMQEALDLDDADWSFCVCNDDGPCVYHEDDWISARLSTRKDTPDVAPTS